jgi:C1A family cysteine protease
MYPKELGALFIFTMTVMAVKEISNDLPKDQILSTKFLAKPNLRMDATWSQFKAKHNKVYANLTEEKFRKEIVSKKLQEIEAHNSNPNNTYKIGLNKFSDLQADEHQQYLGGLAGDAPFTGRTYTAAAQPHLLGATSDDKTHYYTGGIDYRNDPQVLNEVQNQGQCGSCWAFSATAVMESVWAKKNKRDAEQWTLGKNNNMNFFIKDTAATPQCLNMQENDGTLTLVKGDCKSTEWRLTTVADDGTTMTGVTTAIVGNNQNIVLTRVVDNAADYVNLDFVTAKVTMVDDVAKATKFSPVVDGAIFQLWEMTTKRVLLVKDNVLSLYENLPKLSEQQIVSCSTDWNNGCGGGLGYMAFPYMKRQGIMRAKDYQARAAEEHKDEKLFLTKTYESGVQQNDMQRSFRCAYDTKNPDDSEGKWHNHDLFKTTNNGWMRAMPEGNTSSIISALNEFGPLSIRVHVSDKFRDYTKGILSGDDVCDPKDDYNHAVVLVGHGTDDKGVNYWIVRNSWGPTWGEDGYIRIAMSPSGEKGICLVQSHVTFPDLSPEKAAAA